MRILAFGDSITYGAGDSQGGWADRLKREFHQAKLNEDSDHQLFNLGIGGDTSRGLLQRIDSEIQIRTKWPVAVLIAIGVNDTRAIDTKDTYEVPPEEFKDNVKKIVEVAKKYTKRILIIGLTPVDKEILDFKNYWYYNSRIKQYNETLKAIAREENLPFIELLKPMSQKVSAYLISDGLHPNDKGYEFMLERIRPRVLEMVKGIPT
ncbi:MAG: SGNH/GDSL hydrolase family protein [Candidatus Saccharimonadales bacterium]